MRMNNPIRLKTIKLFLTNLAVEVIDIKIKAIDLIIIYKREAWAET